MSTLFTCAPARKNLDHQSDTDLYALLSFNPPAIEGATRAPLNVSVAMDVSGSMQGQKIETARKSLLKLIEHLTERDRLSVVAFSTNVEVILKPTLMSASAKAGAARQVKELHTISSTNLSGGILQSLALCKEFVDKGSVQRALAFTDGQANAGIVDPDELAAAVTEYRGRVGVSTFGIGSDHDPVLLNKLAQDGSFYYIDNPDKILTAFGQELGGLISTYAQNVRVTLTPKEGVEVVEVVNDLKVEDLGGGKATIACDDLLAEQPYHVVVKLKVAKRDNAHPRDVTLLTASVTYFDLVLKKDVTAEASLKVRFVKPGDEDKKDVVEVAEAVGLQLLGQASREAEKLAAQGNFAGARAVFAESAAYSAGIDSVRGIGFGDMVMDLERGYADEEAWKGGGSHTSNALSKGATRQRAAMGGKKIGGVDFDALYASKAQSEVAKKFEAAPAPAAPPDPAASVVAAKPTTSSFAKNRVDRS